MCPFEFIWCLYVIFCKMRSKLFIKITVLSFLISILFASCSSDVKEEKQEFIRPVKIFEVGFDSSNSKLKVFTGIVKESREVKLAFQVAGPISSLNVEEGQYVRKGQLIASISTRDYKIQLEAATAYYDNVKLQADRYAALYAKKSTSKSVLDKSQAALKVAKAKRDAAANSLKDTRIYAPFNGYIQKKYVENQEKVSSAFPIVSILDLRNMKLEVLLSEKDFVKAKTFTNIRCRFSSLNNKVYDATVSTIDHKPNFNKLYKMTLKLDTKDDNSLVPGMLANVEVSQEEANIELNCVPVEAVFSSNGKSCVWIYNDKNSTVEKRFVISDSFNSKGMIRLIKGISKGDKVIIAGVYSVQEGQKVKVLVKSTKTNVGGQL